MHALLHRLRRTSLREVRVRSADAWAIAGERLRFTPGGRWQRRHLSTALTQNSSLLVESRDAINRSDWPGAGTALRSHFLQRTRRFIIHPATRAAAASEITAQFPGARERAIQQAAPLLNGSYTLLGYDTLSFTTKDGDVDWHLDPVHGRRAPMKFWTRVPYLDPQFGDHKVIWELNRHQHWLVLGRAAWLTDDPRYRRRFAQELASWLMANPPLTGINWASMLELAFRSISWVWALHFFAALDDDPVWLVDLLGALDVQLNHVARHLSYYFSPNTHLLGEGLALYIAGRVLPELHSAPRWEALGRDILFEQSTAQINADGGHAELSAHYHRYALDFYLLALAVARISGDPAAHSFVSVTDRLATYCRSLAADDGRLPTLGDDDGGMLFPICGRSPADVSDSLALAAALLDKPDLALGDPPEEVLWMLGGDSSSLVSPSRPPQQVSTLYPDSGYAIMRSPHSQGIVDVGRHGFLNGGHAHADALSLVLTVHGQQLLVDPGTATYTINAGVRDRFRSTPMHNTVLIDNRPQSEPAGPFHWKTRADSTIVGWRPNADCDYLEAEHNGYLPLVHRRVVLRARDDLWIVVDHVLGSGFRRADFLWHFDPAWRRVPAATDSVWIDHPNGLSASVASTASLTNDYCGDPEGLGWCAPVYGRMVPSLTLRFTQQASAPFSVISAIATAVRISITPESVQVASGDRWHRAAASITGGDTTTLVTVATGPASRNVNTDGEAARSVHSVTLPDGEFATDALAAVVRWSHGEPGSLDLFSARQARWNGPGSFELPLMNAAQDLHLDRIALRQLDRSGKTQRAG